MQNKKLDKSLLPKPQHPLGWKKGQLKISTSTANQLLDQQMNNDQAPTRKNSQSNQNSHLFSSKNIQSITTPQSNNQYRQSYNSNRRSYDSRDLQHQLTPSQYSLQQKQLLTFAANQSNERIINFNQQSNGQVLIKDSNIRKNNFSRASNYESSEEKRSNEKRSQSKNKEHKIKVYRHFVAQQQQFIAYSVVTKQSRSGMFLNEKLLVLNSSKRQLSYYSNLPNMLPFSSYAQTQSTYLKENRPKQTIQFDRVRRFMFVPGKGNLAGVMVSFVNELGERRQWRLGMGNNAVMNEWIEMVNEVVKKQHLSVVKSQVKYPPKPKKQCDNKSNNYETKFTKTLKQQVLPLIRQSRLITTTKSIQNNSLNNSNAKSTQNQSSTPRSSEKQYLVDSSKFVNTKNYVIDLEDVRNEDIFYVPPSPKIEQEQRKVQKKSSSSINNLKAVVKSPFITKDEPSTNSRFSQQLQKKQKLINDEHQNRVSTFITKQSQENKNHKLSNLCQSQSKLSQPQIISQPIGLSKKSSGERLSQRSQKDLNIHIDSKISFQEYQIKQNIVGQGQMMKKNQHQKYFSQTEIENVQGSKAHPIQPVSHQFKLKNHPQSPRKRGYTELVIQSHNYQNHRYSHQVNKQNNDVKMPNIEQANVKQKMINQENQSLTEENDYHSSQKKHMKKNNKRALTQTSQIEDIIVGGRLNQGFILNFSPHSFSNNWFRLWLETQPNNKIQIYTSFVKASKSIVSKLIDSPQQFSNCYQMTQNNSHIIFSVQNITFKIPFKLHLPQGLGEFITIMDFIRSQDFLGQVFKYRKEIEDEFENYQFILNQLNSQFNNGILSMPIYLPMCCIVKYKGITVLCKPNIESSNLKIHKIPKSEYSNYESQLQYIEQSCHVSFKLTNEQSPTFDLYQIYLSSFNKSIIYMDNLIKYLPFLHNPLQKSSSLSLQLNKSYIEQHIKTGLVVEKKDVNQIQNHIFQYLLKNVATEIDNSKQLFQSKSFILQKGLKLQNLGNLYKRLDQKKQSTRNQQKLNINISLLMTEIILNEYIKACDIFFMKQFVRQLTSSLIDFNHPLKKSNQTQFSSSNASNNAKTIKNLIPYQGSKSLSFGQKFSSSVIEMLHCLLCRNTKVWTVIANIIDQKYGITEFKNHNISPKEQINVLLKKVNIQQMVINFLQKANAQSQVKLWSTNQRWQDFPINEQNINILPKSKINCLSLNLFNQDYAQLTKQLLSQSLSLGNNLYYRIFQALNISQETYQGQSYLIKSSEYELLELKDQKEKSLIDLSLSFYIPIFSKPSNYLNKDKNIEIYKKLLTQLQGRKSHQILPQNFQISLNGIKWLIKQKQFSLAEVLIQQQLQSLDIWYIPQLWQIKCKLLDLGALFYHKKLGNKKNYAIQYSMRSLKLALQNKHLFKLPQLAEKSFQSANIHFQCQDLQKSLELYELTEEIIYESQKNKTLQQTNLSIQFLNIYLRKAQIKLMTGKTTQTLYSCLQCLRKCQEFQEIVLTNGNQNDSMIERLQQIQLNVFQVIFRCYQVTKNIQDMRRISKVCCSKFVQDKILILRIRNKIQTKSLDDSVNSEMMKKLLKMCWMTLINQLLQKKLLQKTESIQQKPFIPLPQTVKSFCLSGAFSQHNKVISKKTHKVLQDLKQKLLALCNLYPRNRYNNETLTSFICQQIVQNSTRVNKNKNISRAQYEIIGGTSRRMGLLSSRMQYLINNSIKQHQYSDSVLYELFSQVIGELVENDDRKNQSPPRNSMQRFAQSVSFSEKRRSQSKQVKRQQIERESHTRTTVKNPFDRFYRSSIQNQSSDLPFSLQPNQFQPQLSITPKQPINYYNNNDFKTQNYNVYSLKDQMDKKYMLIEALFGLCSREFVLGLLDETIQRVRLNYQKNQDNLQSKTSMFYD